MTSPQTEAYLTQLARQKPYWSAHTRLSQGQLRLATTLLVTVCCCIILWPVRTLICLNTLFLLHCLTILGLRGWLLYLSATRGVRSAAPVQLLPEDALPTVAILCPLYQEADSIEGLLGAICAFDYPKDRLTAYLLLEEDDQTTRDKVLQLDFPDFIRTLITPLSGPRTKPKACTYALQQSDAELVVIYDAEDRPDKDQLQLAAAAFDQFGEEVACLQSRLNYYNREETILTRLFAIEYALLFDLILPGLDQLGAPLPLGGTSNIFRASTLKALGGWDPHNVTEDADLGLRMAAAGYTSRMLESTTYEEATSRIRPWVRQRSRWIKGYMQTWLVHLRRTPQRKTVRFGLTLHLLVGGVVIGALFNPVYWTLYGLWISGLVPGIAKLFPGPLGALATFTLLAGNLFHLWMFMLAPMRRRWFDLVPYGVFAPAYWALQSIAGYKALLQIFRKPFYWEKTSHGPGLSISAVSKKMKEEGGT